MDVKPNTLHSISYLLSGRLSVEGLPPVRGLPPAGAEGLSLLALRWDLVSGLSCTSGSARVTLLVPTPPLPAGPRDGLAPMEGITPVRDLGQTPKNT